MATTRLCVVGATGKFGRALLEHVPADFSVVGAFSRDENRLCGRSLKEAGIGESEVKIEGITHLPSRMDECDMLVFVSKPEVDLAYVPLAAGRGKKIVVGTTGFNEEQQAFLFTHLSRVPSVVAPNFSVGANLLILFSETLSKFGDTYQFSLIEHHHAAKRDAPSGTAKAVLRALDPAASMRVVTDRTSGLRARDEIELYSVRGGTVPGIHRLIASGEDELFELEHTVFSRKAFVLGCYAACRWLALKSDPGVYAMRDVLGW